MLTRCICVPIRIYYNLGDDLRTRPSRFTGQDTSTTTTTAVYHRNVTELRTRTTTTAWKE